VDSLLSQNSIDLNDENLFSDLPLFVAVDKGYGEMVDLLVDKGADINIQVLNSYSNVLEFAILNSPKMVDKIIEKGYNINTKNYSGCNALIFALKFNNNINVVKSLIDHGIDKNYTDDYNTNYLHFAAGSGSKEVYDYLLTVLPGEEQEKTIDNETMIHFAATSGNLGFFKYMLTRGFSINEKDKYGRSVIHFSKSEDILEYILDEFSFDVNEKDDQGMTPLFSVFKINDKEERIKSLSLLIEKGADVNTQTKAGTSPIHEAASIGDYDCVKLLIDNGIDVNVRDSLNSTALHVLAGSKNIEEHPKVVKLLLDSGADKTIRYNNSMTPLDIAQRVNNNEIIDLLK
jgi:ankyrin repeat protein